jgi:hypothetical protein
MHKSEGRPGHRPVAVGILGLLAAVAIAAYSAAEADAAYYKMVACSYTNGAPPYTIDTNTRSSANPDGIFHIWNWCDGQGGDPPGDGAFFRIQEHQDMPHTAGEGAYGNFVFDTPSYVHFKQAGGYTRQPASFNEGWRSRFWVASCCSTAEILSQWQGNNLTSTFSPHLWPYGGVLWDFNRFVFELRCVRPSRCDVSGDVKTDLNGLVFLLSDDSDSRVNFTNTGAAFLAGSWVRGTQNVTFDVSDQGSGVRNERMLVDNAQRWNWDHGGECQTSWTSQNGEWARSYNPCPTGGPWGRTVAVNTATLADGEHAVRLCTEDFGQYQGLYGTKGETCTQRTVRTDNTAPGKPASLEVMSKNPNRYLDRFGAKWSLPPNSGSPIKKVHYDVVDADGKVVVAERTAAGTDPTSLPEIQGPESRGAYRMRVWLEDEVGNVGPAASAEVPRDTTPPAAPQELRIAASSTERWVERFGLRWQNIVDAGSPIDEAHYKVLDGSGAVVVATHTVSEANVQAIEGVQAPAHRGEYTVRVWLSDEEGNVGAPARVPLPLDTTPPTAPQGVSVAAPSASRAQEGFDVRWHDLTDAGSPIDAAHYRVLNAAGKEVVPTTTVAGQNVEAIADLSAPSARGAYTLSLWLSDEEGNVGAPVSVPLSYSCVGSDAGPGAALTSAIARGGKNRVLVRQGRGAALRGMLLGAGGTGVPGGSLCVFSRVVTDADPEFLGIALSGADGRYRFPVPAGPSRDLTVDYRFGHRRISSGASIATKVRPSFKVRRKVVRNEGVARFVGRIPGPHNDRVVVVLQVKRGDGWLAFRRYRTRRGGRFTVGYRFTRTDRPTLYLMRAQVRAQGGYPYVQGTSSPLRLIVLPARHGGR